jgi:hypothetical protein
VPDRGLRPYRLAPVPVKRQHRLQSGNVFFAADALKAHPGSGTVWHHISVKQLKLHPPMVHLLGCNAQEAQR